MNIQFGNPTNFHLLWLVAAMGCVLFVALVARKKALARFATSNLVQQLTPHGSTRRRITKAVLVTTACVALVAALVDVRWGKTWREVPQKGIEVMFVLDVSRSMLAEDVAPNRLERAKQQIRDMIDEMTGDRVGLVVFAGDVRQWIPLTSNYQDFKLTLDEVGPHSAERGGSRLGDAIREATDAFLSKTNDHKAIVAFTMAKITKAIPSPRRRPRSKSKVFVSSRSDWATWTKVRGFRCSLHRPVDGISNIEASKCGPR